MSYFQLINVLIILGSINYSYEFNIGNENLARYIRDASFKSDTQALLNNVFADQKQLEDKIKEAIRKDDDAIKSITHAIMLAADKMAEAGSQDIQSAQQWTTIKTELRQGINIIISAYRRYINLHRDICEAIENFTQSMISKYEDELSTIDEMTVPTLANNTVDTSSAAWARFMARFMHMLNYANVHRQTLQTATDCTGDLMTHTLAYRARIISPPALASRMIRVQLTQPDLSQYASRSFDLPCNAVNEFNGYQSCPYAIADATQQYANSICMN
ncbi:unnamed protein product [Rotaria socialis]|uniref:Uncharacterized protein n=1 Tax=Rotaria socialis TaxID=392032 RepID=A0A818QII0_9BILA|nr:unnamed protein product [Rotaria socialis]CAF4252681.1 unnamed protein product [Rotaria socialis]